MNQEKTYFSKIKVRTKVNDPVIDREVDRREIIFGNQEKILYIKDLENHLLMFLPANDNLIAINTTWSSWRIMQEFQNFQEFILDVVDGGTF
jgi:hypothetical protein